MNLNVVAYELLFRDGFDNAFDWADETEATSRVIVNSFLNFEIENRPLSIYAIWWTRLPPYGDGIAATS